MQVDHTPISTDNLNISLDGYGSEEPNEAHVEREEESSAMDVVSDPPGMQSNNYYPPKYPILAQRHARERGVRKSMAQPRDPLISRTSA
jgi:hypothetical protein